MTNDLPELSDRKKKLLYSAIENYIKVASPITSLFVKQTNLHDLSTATIRNELNALEAMGYLKQLHTSSGRVPTTKGYRFFVDETLKNSKFYEGCLQDVKEDLFARTSSLSEIVESISKVVSTKTNYPTVFMFDGFENLIVEQIKIIYLINNQVLVLIETNAGAISNTISANGEITKQDCDNASNVFSNIFVGKNIKFLNQNIDLFSSSIKKCMKEYESVFNLVLEVLEVYYNKTKSKVSNQGLIKLLESPEFNTNKAKNILSVLDDDDSLGDLMTTNEGEQITVNLGEENNNEKLSNCAVIKAPVILNGEKIATVGVIGPERIDYASVASVLKLITDEVKNKLNKGGD